MGAVTVTAAALLLDMDGTLVDSRAVVERVWTDWSIEHGIDPAKTLLLVGPDLHQRGKLLRVQVLVASQSLNDAEQAIGLTVFFIGRDLIVALNCSNLVHDHISTVQ